MFLISNSITEAQEQGGMKMITEFQSMNLNQRLDVIERENEHLRSRIKRVKIAFGFLIVMLTAMGWSLVASQSRSEPEQSKGGFIYKDAKGRVRASLGADEKQTSVLLKFFDEDDQARASIGLNDGAGEMILRSSKGPESIRLGFDDHGNPILSITDGTAKTRSLDLIQALSAIR
jgi:hypothetical protein